MEEALTRIENHDLRLVALQPAQLEACQQQLIAWTDQKVVAENARAQELEQNLELAKKAGMRSDVIRKHMLTAYKRALFFKKVGEAVRAGYYIIPNMPMDVFAIRTTGNAPERKVRGTWGHANLAPMDPKLLPAGEGDYENPSLAETFRTGAYNDEKGVEHKEFLTISDGFRDEIDFPFALAKPQVLDATRQAMALKIFDEVGVMPARRERRSDPMVIGRLRNPSRRHSRDRDVSFLIAWFLDTDAL